MAKVTTQQRVDWLLAHPQLWEGYGGNAMNSIGTTTHIEQKIFRAMQQDGLISKKTTFLDCAFWRWISKAREQRRNKTRGVI